MRRPISWQWIALLLLLIVALGTRAPAPWRMDVTNDEMHHLESWRNRYKSPDIYPLFLEKLEASGRLSPEKLDLVRRIYRSTPLAPHALLILVDPQPPLYPSLAELTAATTDSSLLTLRLWSTAFSLLAIWIAYLAGREIAGPGCGLWLATLVCIGAVSQYFSGIGRPYALTQLTLLLAIWAFARRQKNQLGLGGFLGWCLLAQAVQWMAWAIVGPLVIVELLRQWRSGAGLWRLARRLWWYAPLSALLLVEMFIQARNPVVTRQGGLMRPEFVWACFSVTSPTGHLGSFGDPALYAGGAIMALLGVIGAAVLLRKSSPAWADGSWLPAGLVAAAAGGVAASIAVGVSVRFEVSYIAPWVVLAAVALWTLAPRQPAASIGVSVVLLLFGWLSFFHPQNPFERIADYDVRWSQVAALMKQQLPPDGRWIGFAPSVACNIYRYGPFPEPIAPWKTEELATLLNSGKVDSVPILLEVNNNYPGLAELVRQRIEVIKPFPAGLDGCYYLVGRVRPSQQGAATARQACR